MAINKKDEFQGQEVKLAQIAKALSHPARITIVKFLAQNGKSLCGDIVKNLPLSQSTISQHLKELKSVSIINGVNDGPRVEYSINNDQLRLCKIFFDRFFEQTIKAS
ncbi:MAG TPA: metalloregulator ArsR/SmtB family transcription factor [Cytophagaceae bacterium]|jgi:DNA-binding transcriptional ArsR family regulator